MKMISCVSPVTGGELLVNGKDVRHNGRAIKKMLGVVSQADSLDSGLNVLQNLMAFTRYFNMPKKIAIARVWEALELFQLTEKAYQNPDELSGGMRRRLLIGRSLLHDPQILVLDEPTTGLDPPGSPDVMGKAGLPQVSGHHHFADHALYGGGSVPV